MSQPQTHTPHSPEPWSRHENEDDVIIDGNGDAIINGDCEGLWWVNEEGNVPRVIACVNNCAGLNPEAVPELIQSLRLLLDAVDYTRNCSPIERVGAVLEMRIIDGARAALRKATEQP